MKRLTTKRYKKQTSDVCKKQSEQQSTFHQVSRAFTASSSRPSQHNKIISVIKQQIEKSDKSEKLRKDYENLMELVNCNKRVHESRQKSIMSFKNMKNINKQKSYQKFYQPLYLQIQNTEQNRSKKKYNRYNSQKLKSYLQKKQKSSQQFSKVFDKSSFKGVKEAKMYIPSQAKLEKKLNIFGQILQEDKEIYIQQIKNIIKKQKQKNPDINQKYKIYLINQYLLQKFMSKISQDSSILSVKKRNSQIYEQIKNEMVSQLIHQNDYLQMLGLIQKQQVLQVRPNYKDQRRLYTAPRKTRLKQMVSYRKHQKCGSETESHGKGVSNKSKQSQIRNQFEKIYMQVQKQIQSMQLQLKFNTFRKNNVYSMIEMKHNDQQFII